MASRQARQERLLERQRGAGRQVRNFDLGLVLPDQSNAPLEPRKFGRSRRTPQPEVLNPQRSSRRTPAAELPQQSSSRRTPASYSALQSSSRRIPAAQSSAVKRSRRRPPSATTSRKRPYPDAEHHDSDGGLDDLQETRVKRNKVQHQPVALPAQGDHANILGEKDPNRGTTASGSTKKRKKRKSIGQQSTKRSKLKSSQLIGNSTVDRVRETDLPTANEPDYAGSNLDDDIQDQLRRENTDLERAAGTESEASVLQSVEPTTGTGFTPLQKRKKRVSIGQQSRRKRRPNLVTVKEEPVEEPGMGINDIAEERESLAASDEYEDDVNDKDGDDVNVSAGSDRDDEIETENYQDTPRPASKTQQTKTKRRKKRKSIGQQKPNRVSKGNSSPAGTSVKEVEKLKTQARGRKAQTQVPNQSRNYMNEASRPRSSQARPKSIGRPAFNSKKAKKATTGSVKPSSSKAIPSSKPSKTGPRGPTSGSIPITVYRPPTPTSPAPGDDDQFSPAESPLLAPKAFNAVDVLAQITLERLSNIASKLNAQPSPSRTQRKALELYTKEVESRLRQLSKVLDKNNALNAKMKVLRKEERTLKNKVKEVERGRERVGERREELEARRTRGELESLLGRIEKVARKGWQKEKAGGRAEKSP